MIYKSLILLLFMSQASFADIKKNDRTAQHYKEIIATHGVPELCAMTLNTGPYKSHNEVFKLVAKALVNPKLKNLVQQENGKPKRFLVTGATKGIGKNIAVLLSALGADVVIAGRNQTDLEETKTLITAVAKYKRQEFRTLQIDMNDYDKAISYFSDLVNIGQINAVIHNAGVLEGGLLKDLSIPQIQETTRTNLEAPEVWTRLAMQYNQLDNIAFVSSMSAVAPVNGYTSYAASKAGLSAFAEALRHEFIVNENKTKVSLIQPGPVVTAMYTDKSSSDLPPLTLQVEKTVKPIHPMRVAVSLLEGMAKGQFNVSPNIATAMQISFLNLSDRLRQFILDMTFTFNKRKMKDQ